MAAQTQSTISTNQDPDVATDEDLLARAKSAEDQAQRSAQTAQKAVSELEPPKSPAPPSSPAMPQFDPNQLHWSPQQWKKAGAAALIVGAIGSIMYKGNGYLAGAMFGGAMKAMQLGEHQAAQNYLNAYDRQIQQAWAMRQDEWKRYLAVLNEGQLGYQQKVDKLKLLFAETGQQQSMAQLELGNLEAVARIQEVKTTKLAEAARVSSQIAKNGIKQWQSAVTTRMAEVDKQIKDQQTAYAAFTKAHQPELMAYTQEGALSLSPEGYYEQGPEWNLATKHAKSQQMTASINAWFPTAKLISVNINMLKALRGQLAMAKARSQESGLPTPEIVTPKTEAIPTAPPKGGKHASVKDERYLMAHPDKAQSFFDTYQYLPQAFMTAYAPEPVSGE